MTQAYIYIFTHRREDICIHTNIKHKYTHAHTHLHVHKYACTHVGEKERLTLLTCFYILHFLLTVKRFLLSWFLLSPLYFVQFAKAFPDTTMCSVRRKGSCKAWTRKSRWIVNNKLYLSGGLQLLKCPMLVWADGLVWLVWLVWLLWLWWTSWCSCSGCDGQCCVFVLVVTGEVVWLFCGVRMFTKLRRRGLSTEEAWCLLDKKKMLSSKTLKSLLLITLFYRSKIKKLNSVSRQNLFVKLFTWC